MNTLYDFKMKHGGGPCPCVLGDKICAIPGDKLEPGAICNKSFTHCRDKFHNEIHFSGQPLTAKESADRAALRALGHLPEPGLPF